MGASSHVRERLHTRTIAMCVGSIVHDAKPAKATSIDLGFHRQTDIVSHHLNPNLRTWR